MDKQNNKQKREIDADEVIREYVESSEQPVLPMQDDNQADVEWYDQAGQDGSAGAR